MILRLLIIISTTLAIALGFCFYRLEHKKIAYIDFNKLSTGYKGMVSARQNFEKKSLGWQANIDTLTVGVQQAISRYEHRLPAMSGSEQQLARESIKGKQKQLLDYQQSVQASARQEELKSTQLILNRVNIFLEQYGQDHDYEMILVATQSGNIAYARPSLDITDEVVNLLNQEYQSTH